MSADITEERIEATILAIRERLSFNRSIEEQTVLALYAQRNEARSQLAALRNGLEGVEVPDSEMGRALETHLPYTADCNTKDVAGYRIGFRIGWSAARLVPTPPQADAVMVPRSAAEYAIRAFDWIECPDPEHYEALRAFHDALRTSAQDHNGEGAK